ncbi:alcohol dehydrogenase, propanol-preferring [Nocardioides exalbidus]|uniref:Alcohol dehydrogenase, propanol-preferring n=1 Tax=Nocardioides exalbidus TaxID=402596 RepID=A0A1H4LMM5_9ACTN|nr:NAD(P)-dependent alcohol dehydrogenase [Nocardioides exalbidus]SEB71887.1 alcohol dehydrogenase, propanol-preferring [Nocardioides exalbidus]
MKSLRFDAYKSSPELVETGRPVPGPGEVLLKVAGAGACHSDVAVFTEFDEEFGPAQLRPSFTLGHETSGWVEELGAGVSGFEKGDAYLVYGPTGCGHCRACSRGQDTYCENAATMPYLAIGLGRDGGMAEYVTVPARNLVPLGDADPVAAAPLADAGLTPYHAVKKSLPKLAGGGTYALVIGLGGLGQLAVQIISALTGATVIATDSNPAAMERAATNGALTVDSGPDQAEQIRALTGGRGVDAVFDLVGIAPTIELAMKVVALQGRVTVVGIGNGSYDWNFYGVPYEVELTSTYWGTVEELHEVVDLYRAGKITPQVELFSLDEAPLAYEKLIAGELAGRAVVSPAR